MQPSLVLASLMVMPLGACGLQLAQAEAAQICAPPETVTVTETVSREKQFTTSPELLSTSTMLQVVTVTDTITVVGSSSKRASSKTHGHGGTVYPFSMSSGHTAWVGPTPTKVGQFQMAATTVTVYPTEAASGVNTSEFGDSSSSTATATTTEFSTIFSTETITVSPVENSTAVHVPSKTSRSVHGASAPFGNITTSLGGVIGSTGKPHVNATIHTIHYKTKGHANTTAYVTVTSNISKVHNNTTLAGTIASSHPCNVTDRTTTQTRHHSKVVTLTTQSTPVHGGNHSVTSVHGTFTSTTKSMNATSLASETSATAGTSTAPPGHSTMPSASDLSITSSKPATGTSHSHTGFETSNNGSTGDIGSSSTLAPPVIKTSFPLLSIYSTALGQSLTSMPSSTTNAVNRSVSTQSTAPPALSSWVVPSARLPILSSYALNPPPVKPQGNSLNKRSMSEEVYATINGKPVSWANDFGGNNFSPSITGASVTPVILSTTSQVQPTMSEITSSFGSTTSPRAGSTVATIGVPSAPTACPTSELGNFTIGFDDLPTYDEPANKNFYPPIRSPYHNLMWSEGWSYAPPPAVPFSPVSGHQLGVFLVTGSTNVHSQNYTGSIPSSSDVNGMFGAGPNYYRSAFWFDAHSLFLGCAIPAGRYCEIQINGWKFDQNSGRSCLEVHQEYMLIPYSNNTGLQPLPLPATFSNLTALQIVATDVIAAQPVTYYVDNIDLAWSNNTCAAASTRLESL